MSLQSEQINELMGALSKAQGAMTHAKKDSQNPHFRSAYADLASVWQACREPLSKHGLAVTQTLDIAGEKQVLVTTLSHSSGQWIKSLMIVPVQRPGPQELGSCISYCRRYSLAAIVGVYQDDDDAEVAQAPYRQHKPIEEHPASLSEAQKRQLDEWVEEFPEGKDWMLKQYKLDDVHDLPVDKFKFVATVFEKKRKEKNQ